MAYELYLPVIQAASFSSNPARINARIVLSVQVIDSMRILEPEPFNSAEIYSGEV